jgi:hypothetical protein
MLEAPFLLAAIQQGWEQIVRGQPALISVLPVVLLLLMMMELVLHTTMVSGTTTPCGSTPSVRIPAAAQQQYASQLVC